MSNSAVQSAVAAYNAAIDDRRKARGGKLQLQKRPDRFRDRALVPL
jgi:hypothetical protein